MVFAVFPAVPAILVFLLPAQPRGAGAITNMKVSPTQRRPLQAWGNCFPSECMSPAPGQPFSSSSSPWAASPRQQAEAATLLPLPPYRRNGTVTEIIMLWCRRPCSEGRSPTAAYEANPRGAGQNVAGRCLIPPIEHQLL